MLLCFSSVLAPKSLQNGLQSGPGGAPGCPGGGPGGPGGGSDVQMSILEAPECRAVDFHLVCLAFLAFFMIFFGFQINVFLCTVSLDSGVTVR